MSDVKVKRVEVDVLVMGAGGAGTRAAIAAAGGGAKTVIASKDLFGHSWCTPVAKGGYGDMQGHPGDSWKVHLKTRSEAAAGTGWMSALASGRPSPDVKNQLNKIVLCKTTRGSLKFTQAGKLFGSER